MSAASVKFLLPLLRRDFADFANRIYAEWSAQKAAGTKGARLIGEQRVIGALSPDLLAFLRTKGIDPQSAAIAITDRQMFHMIPTIETAKSFKGSAIDFGDIFRLPDVVASPRRILWDETHRNVLYVYDDPTERQGRAGKLAISFNVSLASPEGATRANMVTTAKAVDPSTLKGGMYELVEP